ncbi:hypothetical protein NKJ00_22335 [Mesorhizobium sp. M0227]
MANFYSNLINGRDLTTEEINEHWTEIANPGLSIALHSGGKKTSEAKLQDIKLCFHAPNSTGLDETMRRIGASVVSERLPVDGVLVKDFLDPEGNEFSIEVY